MGSNIVPTEIITAVQFISGYRLSK